MSEPTGPTSAESEGWPPRPPMGPNPATTSYPTPAPQNDYPQPAYQQVYVEKAPSVLEGEKLAKTSTILGIVSLTTGLGAFIGPFAIVKAAKAEKLGVDSTVGKVTGWLGTIFGAIAILITILYIALFGALLASGNGFDSKDIKSGGFSNSQNDKMQSDTPKSNFDKIYEKLTPAEKAEMDKQLEQLDAVVSNR